MQNTVRYKSQILKKNVCMYVCMYACMYVCMYVYMYACTYVCMYVCMHVCMYACMYVCMYVYMYVELNPGPVTGRNRQCYVLYSNIRGLYGNLHDLIVASKGFDILFCSKTLVSNFRHISELAIPSFKDQYYLNLMK